MPGAEFRHAVYSIVLMSGINFGVPQNEDAQGAELNRDGSDLMGNETTIVNNGISENNGAAAGGTAVSSEVGSQAHRLDNLEVQEWLESLDSVLESSGPEVATEILERLRAHATVSGIELPFTANTPYANTIPNRLEPLFPGDQELERRIKSLIRWNALAMVVRANRVEHNIGGHISTYASAATLYEVGFNHFFRGRTEGFEGDTVYFQGHAAPGIYARAFIEGRISAHQLENFRRELKPGGGLSSYPHPWLMPDFWEFPTVSMGLSPLMAIYQARFNRYLEDRG